MTQSIFVWIIVNSMMQHIKTHIHYLEFDDILEALQGANYFGCINLTSGYWDIKVPEERLREDGQGLAHALV